jgi:anti-sigma factor RsiW
MTHLGEQVSALVDGELDHDARDRALAHLTGCADCRAEVDAERRAKARLSRLADPGMPPDVPGRLHALHAELSAAGAAGGPWRTEHRPRRRHRASLHRRGSASTRRPPSAARRRRFAAATTGALVVVAGGAAFLLGGGPAGGRAVTPQVDRFSVEHAAVTPEVPLTDQGAVLVSFPGAGAP